MAFLPGLAFLLACLGHLAWARNESRPISNQLFDSLEELSRLVDISYCVGTTGVQEPFQCLSHCAEFPNLELVTTWNTGVLLSDSCGYIALSHSPTEKRIIVAFRGTYSITNTIIDLSAYPQAYVPYTGNDEDDKPRNRTEPPGPRCENCTVHAGFMASWLNTRSTVLAHVSAARAQYPDYEVTLAGHSLGGAVAALAGLEMHLKGWNPTVTTFGEPMVGNQRFAEHLDEQFQVGPHSKAVDELSRAQRFRRVTHVDDPVPLLPLAEWGYAAHSGEIFISQPSLPPSIGDVQSCVGSQDPRCIAGSDTTVLLQNMYQDENIPLVALQPDLDLCSSRADENFNLRLGHQVVLGGARDGARNGPVACTAQDVTAPLHPLHWDWSLIPSRYRFWELFYAHRDYFWRIGLCVPGGDPTG